MLPQLGAKRFVKWYLQPCARDEVSNATRNGPQMGCLMGNNEDNLVKQFVAVMSYKLDKVVMYVYV